MRGWWWQIRRPWWENWRFRRVSFSTYETWGWINGHFAIRYLYGIHVGPIWIERWEVVTARLGVPKRDFQLCRQYGHPGYSAVDVKWRGSWWPTCSRCGGPRSFARGTIAREAGAAGGGP